MPPKRRHSLTLNSPSKISVSPKNGHEQRVGMVGGDIEALDLKTIEKKLSGTAVMQVSWEYDHVCP